LLKIKRFSDSTVGVLLGGLSREREISIKTGTAIADALSERGYRVERMDVSRNICSELKDKEIGVAFVALHGRWGEDGTIQGLLEILQIPYTGSGVAASAIAMDKILSKRLFLDAGLPTPSFAILDSPVPAPPRPLPLVVKPASEGSTIGITIVRSEEAWQKAVTEAFQLDRYVLVEDFIEGWEITASILNGKALPLIHIEPKEGFYDYTSKYTPGKTLYHVPAALDDSATRHLQDLAVRAYRTLGCSGCARVDMIYSEETGSTILEVNTIPGMTPTSLVPKAAAAVGMDFGDLTEAILNNASLKVAPPEGKTA
jgi:D-alanine-D-alanine ligase